MNVVVFSGSFSTPPKINILAINSLNDGGVENDPVILHNKYDEVIISPLLIHFQGFFIETGRTKSLNSNI